MEHAVGVDPRSFLRVLPDLIRPLLSPDLRDFRSGSEWGPAKIIYGNSSLHYECWVRPRLQTVEIGLHFEADPLTNARLLGAFRRRERAIRRRLGDAPRFEDWDRGWARIWEGLPYQGLDGALQARLAARLARYVTVLEPILRDELPADVPWRLAIKRRRSSDSPRRARAARGAAGPRA